MKYAIELGDKVASVILDEGMTRKDLDLVKEMLIKAITNRQEDLIKIESKNLTREDSIKYLYPPLSLRTQNVLLRAGFNTIGDVLDSTPTELERVRNMGKKSLEEVKERFAKYGNFKGCE